jgi:chemotaxis regulatin CheY-phosphate phosphatase CheZ
LVEQCNPLNQQLANRLKTLHSDTQQAFNYQDMQDKAHCESVASFITTLLEIYEGHKKTVKDIVIQHHSDIAASKAEFEVLVKEKETQVNRETQEIHLSKDFKALLENNDKVTSIIRSIKEGS